MPRCFLRALLPTLWCGCALGVAPDFHDTGPGREYFEPADRPAAARDVPDAGDAGDVVDVGAPPFDLPSLDLGSPPDVPAPIDRPAPMDLVPVDLGCAVDPARACSPGQRRACGNCGTQECRSDCAWSACSGEGACAAGATRTQPCGNCGTQTQRCSSTCAWESGGGCAGAGPCAPGATQGGGCDPCSQQVCQSNCTWGGCALRPGAACEYQSGRHHRDCGACRCGFQFCLNSCQWSTSCVSCCSTCGGCL